MCQPSLLYSGHTASVIALDSTNVYWIDYDAPTVWQAPKVGGGTPASRLAATGGAIAIDSTYLYALLTASAPTQQADVEYAPIAGGLTSNLATPANGYTAAPQLRVTSQGVYYGQQLDGSVQNNAVFMMTYDGGSSSQLATTPQQMIWWDIATSQTYVSYGGYTLTGTFAEASSDGGLTPLFVSDAGAIIKFELVGGDAYLGAAYELVHVPLDGGAPSALFGTGAFVDMATDGSYIYWADQNFGSPTIYKMAVGSTTRSTIVGYGSATGIYGLAVDDTYVYYGMLSNTIPTGLYRVVK